MRNKTVEFSIEADFEYAVQPLDDDPEDIWEFADQERDEIRRNIARIPGVDSDTIRVKVSPRASDVKNWVAG